MGFAPLDEGLLLSTVCRRGGRTVLAVWSLILASKNSDGITRLTPTTVYDLWTNSREPAQLSEIQAAWDFLASPDPESGNQAEDGRRIVRVEGGWRVVSHARYRDKYTQEKRRRVDAERQRRHRARGGDADDSRWGEPELGPDQATPPPADAGGGREPRASLVAGRRAELEGEWHALIRELSELANEDPIETAAAGSEWTDRHGRRRTKLDPASMSDGHLAKTVLDLRARLADLKPIAREASPAALEMERRVLERMNASDQAAADAAGMTLEEFRQKRRERRAVIQ